MPNKVRTDSDFQLLLPAMGEGIIEATITKWLVSPGQYVKVDQPLVEVATDKVDSEIPSPVEGTIINLVYREGEIPGVGEVIALIQTNNGIPEVNRVQQATPLMTSQPEAGKAKVSKTASYNKPSGLNIAPLVRMIARQMGIGADELGRIHGTGEGGEITRKDVEDFIRQGRPLGSAQPLSSARPLDSARGDGIPDGSRSDKRIDGDGKKKEMHLNTGDEIVEMDRMRKLIATHMLSSKKTAAHVTSFLEADVTVLVKWREEHKEQFLARERARLTFTPVFIEAVAITLKEFPRINVSVSDDSIIFRKGINIGVATALADGNLIVPVIKNADHENLGGLSRRLADLAERARKGALHPEEIRGGTFTITNIGQYNNLTGTPIINQPESAILAFGTILKKPWAVKTSEGYGVAVRDIMMLALTYDHRVIDGALGGSFLSKVAYRLENFDFNRDF